MPGLWRRLLKNAKKTEKVIKKQRTTTKIHTIVNKVAQSEINDRQSRVKPLISVAPSTDCLWFYNYMVLMHRNSRVCVFSTLNHNRLWMLSKQQLSARTRWVVGMDLCAHKLLARKDESRRYVPITRLMTPYLNKIMSIFRAFNLSKWWLRFREFFT